VKGQRCFQIPKVKAASRHPIFCVECTVAIVEQTKIELSMVEQDVRWKG